MSFFALPSNRDTPGKDVRKDNMLWVSWIKSSKYWKHSQGQTEEILSAEGREAALELVVKWEIKAQGIGILSGCRWPLVILILITQKVSKHFFVTYAICIQSKQHMTIWDKWALK